MSDYPDRYSEDDPLPEKLQTPLDCKRENYSMIMGFRTYCKIEKDCIYRDEHVDAFGGYRCMCLEHQV